MALAVLLKMSPVFRNKQELYRLITVGQQHVSSNLTQFSLTPTRNFLTPARHNLKISPPLLRSSPVTWNTFRLLIFIILFVIYTSTIFHIISLVVKQTLLLGCHQLTPCNYTQTWPIKACTLCACVTTHTHTNCWSLNFGNITIIYDVMPCSLC
jgi:hypothetical protein